MVSTDFFSEINGCLVSATVEESIWCPKLGDEWNERGWPKDIFGVVMPPTFLRPVRTDGGGTADGFLVFLLSMVIIFSFDLKL